MGRTSAELQQSEIAAFQAFAAQHGIKMDGEEGVRNGEILGGTIVNANEDITPTTLAATFEQVRGQLAIKTTIEREYDKNAARMSEQERNLILSFISRRNLKDQGDDLLTNFNIIAAYFVEKNMPIAADTIGSALTNIINGGKRRLLWKPARLQDSEREAQQKREAASQQPARQEQRAEAVGENTLAPHLREHRRQMHAALAEAAAKKAAESQPVNRDSEWQNRAENAVASIQSNIDRAEAQKLLTKAGAWSWELVFKNVTQFIEKRKYERSTAGRR